MEVIAEQFRNGRSGFQPQLQREVALHGLDGWFWTVLLHWYTTDACNFLVDKSSALSNGSYLGQNNISFLHACSLES